MFYQIICITASLLFILVPQVKCIEESDVISECPGRSVPSLRLEAETFELSFIFYYVSWSSSARQALRAFDNLATNYFDQAYFAATDCWHMQCNCSRTHEVQHGTGAPNVWPTMIVRYGRHIKLQYHGSWDLEDLMRFVQNIIHPLERVQTNKDVKVLGRSCNAIVLALCSSAQSLEYKRFVAIAIKWLEIDPQQNIRFAIAFGDDAKSMVKRDAKAKLPLLVLIDSQHNNKVNIYNLTGTWNFKEIFRWIQLSLKNVYQYVNGGYNTPRSLVLKSKVGPVLALSVNEQPFEGYFNTIMSEYLGLSKDIYRQHSLCETYYWDDDLAKEDLLKSAMLTDLDQPSTQCTRKIFLNTHEAWKNYYHVNFYLDNLWKTTFTYSNTIDEDNAKHLLALHQRNKCLLMLQPHIENSNLKIGIVKLIKNASHRIWLDIPEHRRQHQHQNHSLSVVLLNTAKHKDFLVHHGIPLDTHSAANVFIVDVERESVYIMKELYSYKSLLQFMHDYYAGYLQPLEKSDSSLLPMPSNENAQYIATYNRQLLLQVLQLQNVTNVLFLYTPGCELCAVMSQSFIQLSLLMQSEEIRFIRLNTHENTLPWELVMPTSPAMLVFPASHSAESRIFPAHLKADVRNMFGFVLAQLKPETQLRLILASCKRSRHLDRCLDFAKTLVMKHIGQYLKLWEIYETERQQILEHLKSFNDIHIRIQSSIRI